jgi:hypothetical protein
MASSSQSPAELIFAFVCAERAFEASFAAAEAPPIESAKGWRYAGAVARREYAFYKEL